MIMFLKDCQHDGLFYCSFMSVFQLTVGAKNDILHMYVEMIKTFLEVVING